MTKSKKSGLLIALAVCACALLSAATLFFGAKTASAAEPVEVQAKDFVVNNFFQQPDQNRSVMYIGYIGNASPSEFGNCIATFPNNGWTPYIVTYNDGTKSDTKWVGSWQESTWYSVIPLDLNTSSWKEITIPKNVYQDVTLVDDIVIRRAGDTWVAGSYKSSEFSVAASGTDGENKSYIYLTNGGSYNLIQNSGEAAWASFKDQAQKFTAKKADGTSVELTSDYFQLDPSTLYIKFANAALDGCTELTVPEGAYQLGDNSYRYFESGFTFYSAHNGCWSAQKGEIQTVKGTEATCDNDGVKDYYTCTVCGKNYADINATSLIEDIDAWKNAEGKIAALGHSGEWEKGEIPTLTAGGTLVMVCERCEARLVTDIPALNATDYVYDLKAAACEEEGSAEFDYEYEGQIFIYEIVIPKAGHKLVEKEGAASTCSEYGYKAYYECSVCHKCFEDESGENAIADIEAWKKGDGRLSELGEHDFGEWTEVKAPTAEEKGLIKRVCKADESHEETFELPALNDKDYAYTVVTEARCEEEGSAQYVYDKDGKTFEFVVKLEKLGHNYSEEWNSDENGHWHACERCDAKKDEASHEDKNSDGKCDECGATVKTSGGKDDGKTDDGKKDDDKKDDTAGENGGCKSSVSAAELSVAMLAIIAASAVVAIKRRKD